MPLSRAMAYNRRLALVMLALEPLMKQTASIRDMTVVPAREEVARRSISTMGICVGVLRMESGSVSEKRMTRMNKRPLVRMVSLAGAFVGARRRKFYIRDSPDCNCVDECSWAVSFWIRHLFRHVQHYVKCYEREGRL